MKDFGDLDKRLATMEKSFRGGRVKVLQLREKTEDPMKHLSFTLKLAQISSAITVISNIRDLIRGEATEDKIKSAIEGELDEALHISD